MILTHKTVSLADQVFDRLESDILSGVYKRGEILTEVKLCEALGSSGTELSSFCTSGGHLRIGRRLKGIPERSRRKARWSC